jgi:diacylglycerol kinase family enzyme
MSATAILSGVAGALRGGGVKPTPTLDEQIELGQFVVEAIDPDRPVPYQVDGDYLGDTSRLEFDHVPDAVRLVFPRTPGENDEPSVGRL